MRDLSRNSLNKRILLLSIIIALIYFFNVPGIPEAGAQDVRRDDDKLLSKALTLDSVRVIVGLNTPFVPEGKLSVPQEASKQQERISKIQDRLVEQLSKHKAKGIKRFRHIPYMAVEVDSNALKMLVSNPLVTAIEEDVPVPPILNESIPLINADDAWASGYNGFGWTVAILDTGVDKTHSFLTGKVVSEACFSTTDAVNYSTTVCPNGQESQTGSGAGVNCPSGVSGCDHGTHVAGIAAGKADTINGVAKEAGLIAVQVFSRFDDAGICGASTPCALSYTSDQLSALEHVYSLRSSYNIASINMSLGGGKYTSNCDSDSRKAAIDNLRSVGIATIIASGNDGYTDGISSPACISTAVSVGATTKADAVASYSNSSSLVSLLAPGSSIYSSIPGNSWASWNGTSMATPHVAGAWAVLKHRAPAATVADILNALQGTGVLITDTRNNVTKPRIDLLAALNAMSCTYSITPLSNSMDASGGSGSISVTTQAGCSWVAANYNPSWLTITSGLSGTGNGTVNYTVSANSGLARTGTITVGGQTFTLTQSGSAIALIDESFTSCATPSGWSVVDNAGTGAIWRFNDPASRANNTGGSGCFAIADSDYAGSVNMDTELRTPPVNLSGYSSVSLEFKRCFSYYEGEIADVDVSVNGASGPWTNVYRISGADYPCPVMSSLYISDTAAAQSNVMVRFRYYNANFEYWWQLDDVRLIAKTPTTTADDGFNPNANNGAYSLAVQPDGKVLVSGGFTSIGGQTRNYIARLNPDGSLDLTFDPDANNIVRSLAVQPDGKILVGGLFTSIGGQTRNYIARLNPDGSLDPTFAPDANSDVLTLALQADGKILVGGFFTSMGGQTRNYIARLNPNGSLDQTFDLNANDYVYPFAVQADGKILVGGSFTNIGGQTRNRIARLNPDGSLDTTFDPDANSSVGSIVVQTDGKIVVVGSFTNIGGQTRNRIARLNPDGSLDTTFDPDVDSNVLTLALQADGKILVGGLFGHIGGQTRNRIARLNPDGSLDTTFDPDANPSSSVVSISVQADGKVLVSGGFTSIGGQVRNAIARLNADASAFQELTVSADGTTVTWMRSGSSPDIFDVTFEESSNMNTWTPIGAGERISGGWQLTGLALPFNQNHYIRARGKASGGLYNASTSLIESVRLYYNPGFTLTVNKTGSGTVTATGINCGADCSEVYASGTIVTLSAIPDSGSTFTGWSGDADCSDGVVTMDADKICTANFAGTPNISSSPTSLNFGDVNTNTTSPSQTVTFTNTGTADLNVTDGALSGTDASMFAIIGGTCPNPPFTSAPSESCNLSYTFTPVSAGSKTATFTINSNDPDTPALAIPLGGNGIAVSQYTLTVEKTGTGSGTVTATGINCGSDCTEIYTSGTVVTLSPAPDTGSAFTGWTGCDSVTGNTCDITMNTDKTVTAEFIPSALYVVWADDTYGNNEIFIKKSTDGGTNWTTTRLTNNTGNSQNPVMSVDGSTVYIIWQDDTYGPAGVSEIFLKKSTDGGTNWTTTRLTDNTGNSVAAASAASGNDIYVVWQDDTYGNYETFLKKSTDGGANWTTTRLTNNAGNSQYPSIVVNNAIAYIVWQDDTYGNNEIFIKKSTDGGANWTTTRLTNNAGNSQFSVISRDAIDNSLYVVWQDDTYGNNETFLKKSTDGGANWTTTRLTNNAGSSQYPSIVVNNAIAYIVWQDDTYGPAGVSEIFLKKSTDSGTNWTTTRLTNNAGNSQLPIVMGSGSEVYIVWQDDTYGNNEIFIKKSTDGGTNWTTTRLTNNAGNSAMPVVPK